MPATVVHNSDLDDMSFYLKVKGKVMSKVIFDIDDIFNNWKSCCNYSDSDGDVAGECSVGRITNWGAHYIAIIHDDVPEDERCELAEFIANTPQQIKAQQATIDKLVKQLIEMDSCLNHGHGTSIGCDSIFHREMKDLINSVTEKK